MGRFEMKKMLVLLFFCIFLFGQMNQMIFADSLWEDKEVLILNSYSPDNVWTDSLINGIYDAFSDVPYNINYQVEFMYSKRNYSDEYFESFLDHFVTKYKDKKFNLVITTDDNAYEFLVANRAVIAGDAPVVFTGINNLDAITVGKNTTGIHEKIDVLNNLKLIESNHGKGTKVVVFSDYSQTSKRVMESIEQALIDAEVDLEIEEMITDNPNEIISRANTLSDEVALFVLFNRDFSGKYYSYNEGLALATRVTNVPIYSFWSFYLNHGIVGGQITDGHQLGYEAGIYGNRILNGLTTDELPVIECQNSYIFDQEELIKHNIEVKDMSDNVVLINVDESDAGAYFKIVPVLGIATIILIALTLSYITLQQKNKALENELTALKESYSHSLEEEKVKYEEKISELIDQEEKLIQINEFLEEALQEKSEEIEV